MRKETKIVEFLCDECGESLPKEFIKKNCEGEEYFDKQTYNHLTYVNAGSITTESYWTLELEDTTEYVEVKRDFCPKCRIKKLKEIIKFLERQNKENNS